MHLKLNRRDFVAGAGAALSVAARRHSFANISSDEAWARAADIAHKVKAPTFPDRVFDITKFGARADGTLNTSAIARAIAACAKAGGGRVLVPAGTFLTGAIHLKSNVELHVSEGATLMFDTNPASYPMVFTRWEGMELMNYSPLIYARSEKNIAITGKGTLDGQGSDTELVAVEGPVGRHDGIRLEGRHAGPAPGAQEAVPHGRGRGAGRRSACSAKARMLRPPFIQPYRLRERAHRRRARAQFAVLEHPSRAVQEHHPARRGYLRPRA